MPLNKEITTDAATNNQHPLDDFWGTVHDIYDEERPQRTNTTKFNNFIVFDFANLEIIKANQPYTFQVTKVDIMEINIPGSQWEVFKESLRKCGFEGNLNGLIGKRIHIRFAPAILNQRRNDGVAGYTMSPGHCWQIMEIEGVENTSDKLMAAVVELANGANAAEFKTKFMSDTSIRNLTGYSDAVVAVMSNSLLPSLVTANKLQLVGDIYTKV